LRQAAYNQRLDIAIHARIYGAGMAVDPPFGRIAVNDVGELNWAVSPWDLEMRQVSSGTLHATLDFLALEGMLLSRERWSHSVLATGATPEGYVALAGPSSHRSFKWCGEEIAEGRVLCGIDAREIDFMVPDEAAHWVILVPIGQFSGWLDDESAFQALKGQRVLRCSPGLTQRISRTVDWCVDVARSCPELLTGNRLSSIMVRDLREAVTSLMTRADGAADSRIARRRDLACRRAMSVVNRARQPVRVSEMAAAVGVSRKSLERAFRDRLGITPRAYCRLHLMSRLYRALRVARPGETTVTRVALSLGLTELGRMAGEYRRIFGELPSTTLAGDGTPPDRQLRDALPTGPDS
jgi:AraC-like DNA-binding protein